MSFLNAEWRKLALANYTIDPQHLRPLVPAGTELDLWQGRCYVSLVGFRFLNTRLLGIPVPFHRNFDEVNLRFYVKVGEGEQLKRGVVFVKELVPRRALTFVANTVYREHYQTVPMRSHWEETPEGRTVRYDWRMGGEWQSFTVQAAAQGQAIGVGTEEEFITEHYWGYTRRTDLKTFQYEVTHPRWEHYPVTDYRLAVDFERTYGPGFAFLNDLTPTSVMLAEGSPITVEGRSRLKF